MARLHRDTHPESVTRCPAPGCEGVGAVEHSMKNDTWYVVRSRGCNVCGRTWSTAEIPLRDLQRLRRVEKVLKLLREETNV